MSTAHVVIFAAIIVVPFIAEHLAHGLVKVARHSFARWRARQARARVTTASVRAWRLVALGTHARFDEQTIERIRARL